MSWTEEKVNKLKELWGKGNTASQIAEIIGGITRNAVIGKAHRLNLSAKIKTRTVATNKNFENSVDGKKIKTRFSKKSRFKSLIIEKDFYFCGRTALKDFSYCKLHLLYSYQSKNKKDDPIDKEEIPEFIEKKIKSA